MLLRSSNDMYLKYQPDGPNLVSDRSRATRFDLHPVEGSDVLVMNGSFVGLRKDAIVDGTQMVKLEIVSVPQLRVSQGNKLQHIPSERMLDAYGGDYLALWQCLSPPRDTNQIWRGEPDKQQPDSATKVLQSTNGMYLALRSGGQSLVNDRAHASRFKFCKIDEADILTLNGRFVGLCEDAVVEGDQMFRLEFASEPQMRLQSGNKLLHIPTNKVLDAYGGNYITLWRCLPEPRDANQIWIIQAEEATQTPVAVDPKAGARTRQHGGYPSSSSSAVVGEASGWTGDETMSIQSDSHQIVQLSANCTPGGLFRHPVFFGQAQLSRKQSKSQPVLVMSSADWKHVSDPSTTHEGAFGSDYDAWPVEKIRERWIQGGGGYDPSHTSWVLVWKFPGDLNHLAGFRRIVDIPLPVGCYPLLDDDWWKPPRSYSDGQLHKGDAVEKLRADLVHGGSIHHLESQTGIQVAMIGSTYFIKEFWSATMQEIDNVKLMLEELYRNNIYAFPCYGQHHAIVFYIDLTDKRRITPQRLAEILKSQERGRAVLEILQRHASASLSAWADNYIRIHAE